MKGRTPARTVAAVLLATLMGPANAEPYAEWDDEAYQNYQPLMEHSNLMIPEADQVPFPLYPGARLVAPPTPAAEGSTACTIGLGVNGDWASIKAFYRKAAGSDYEAMDVGYTMVMHHRERDDLSIMLLKDSENPAYQSLVMLSFDGQGGYECEEEYPEEF